MRYTFRPRPLIVLGYALMLSAMLALGVWQLERADEKIELLDKAALSRETPAVPVETLSDPVHAASRYRQVLVDGCLLGERQLLWDNRSRDGQPGFEVLTPVRLADTRLVLINRGWLPLGPSRQDLPAAPVKGDEPVCVSVQGTFTRPSKGFMSGPALDAGDAWPRLLQYFDYPAIARALGEPIVAGVVQWQAGEAAPDQAQVLEANWQPAASGPERHYGYAFQWFAMAVALTVLFVLLNARRANASGGMADSDTPGT